MSCIASKIYKKIALKMPDLSGKLMRAGIDDSPERFIKKTVSSAFIMTFGIAIIILVLLSKTKGVPKIVYAFFPFMFVFLFFYYLKFPDVRITRKEKDIDREIVYAGRFIAIEVESGVPLYNALAHLKDNYPVIGKYMNEIINKIDMGTAMEDAINETIELSPSANLRRILWQIVNSLKTGGDLSKSLSSVIDQITKEQTIEIKEYGKKLNPLAMFYMMAAVILPTLGITMVIMLVNFMGISLSLPVLLVVAFFLGFIQFMFLNMVKSSRPAVEF